MKAEGKNNRIFFPITCAVIACVILLSAIGAATYAWLASDKGLLSYAPISSPEALRIGAGNGDNIRYMRFDGLDVEGEETYFDKVFCVYGSGVANYKIQLAYTTNNPFTYSIFPAAQSTEYSEGAVEYVTRETTPRTFYYSVDGAAISGIFLNKDDPVDLIANDDLHDHTYGEYDNVQVNAEPVYWQTANAEEGSARSSFIHYYILRIYKNGKTSNDRETDVLCIAARTV